MRNTVVFDEKKRAGSVNEPGRDHPTVERGHSKGESIKRKNNWECPRRADQRLNVVYTKVMEKLEMSSKIHKYSTRRPFQAPD